MIVAQALGSKGMRADEEHSVHIFNEDATASMTRICVLQLRKHVVRSGPISMSPADLAKKHHVVPIDQEGGWVSGLFRRR
jgi:hypothetical protein